MTKPASPSNPSPKQAPTYEELRKLDAEIFAQRIRVDHRRLLHELMTDYETIHLPVEFLELVVTTDPAAIDMNAARTGLAMKNLLTFLYAPACDDALKIVAHFVGPHFEQLVGALIAEKAAFEESFKKTNDYDVRIQFGRIRRQIETLLAAATFARTRYKASKIAEDCVKKGRPITPIKNVWKKDGPKT